jgi:hypothetical protein
MGDANSRATSLRTEHASLDAQIRAEEARPRPDSLLIRSLKKKKLQVKGQLEQLGLTSGKRKTVRPTVTKSKRRSAQIIDFPVTANGGDQVIIEDRIKVAAG